MQTQSTHASLELVGPRTRACSFLADQPGAHDDVRAAGAWAAPDPGSRATVGILGPAGRGWASFLIEPIVCSAGCRWRLEPFDVVEPFGERSRVGGKRQRQEKQKEFRSRTSKKPSA